MTRKHELKRNIGVLKINSALSGAVNFLPLVLAFLIAQKLKIPKENIFYIEIAYLITVTIGEIPTGVISDKIGAKYPAEHNVGHVYEADDNLRKFYKKLDPCNIFNPGIGKTSKTTNKPDGKIKENNIN